MAFERWSTSGKGGRQRSRRSHSAAGVDRLHTAGDDHLLSAPSMRFAAFGLDLLRRADGATLDEREENRLVADVLRPWFDDPAATRELVADVRRRWQTKGDRAVTSRCDTRVRLVRAPPPRLEVRFSRAVVLHLPSGQPDARRATGAMRVAARQPRTRTSFPSPLPRLGRTPARAARPPR